MMWAAWSLAWLLELMISEPRRFHPIVGFGRAATWLEQHLNTGRARGLRGLCAWLLLVGGVVAVASCSKQWLPVWWVDGVALWIALGVVSLYRHVQAVDRRLQSGDLEAARLALCMIVSRDTVTLDATQVCAATIETTLENGSDAIFASLFWFVLGASVGYGAEAVLLHRAANTLDAMWGYRTPRFEWFGKTAARADDLLNYWPARLTALSYALLGNRRLALHCWSRQASQHDSPNAGVVMAAGAGALSVQLGGGACYAGVWHERPCFGQGHPPTPTDLQAAIRLVYRTLALWWLVISLGYCLCSQIR